jgi:catalase
VWPDNRKLISLGIVCLTGPVKDQVSAQKVIMLSPLNLQSAIEPSGDPVLLARPAVYGASFSPRIR